MSDGWFPVYGIAGGRAERKAIGDNIQIKNYGSLTLDTQEMHSLHRRLRNLSADMQQAIRPLLRDIGNQVKDRAAQESSWSTRIPGSLGLHIRFDGGRPGIAIYASASKAPHARMYEGILQDIWRHPTFGRREEGDWFPQAARPFLYPAVDAMQSQIVADIEAALVKVTEHTITGG